MKLVYDRGTLILLEAPGGFRPPPYFKYDPRSKCYRTLAANYRRAVRDLPGVEDHVIRGRECRWTDIELPLRDYQRAALEAWLGAGKLGVIVLPTGAGKTRIALAAVSRLRKPTLIVAPTLELVDQWVSRVSDLLGIDAAEYTGESKEIGCVTVSTYSSAYLNAEYLGDKFHLLVFDEVHHLPSEAYRQIAELSAAPYRLGLTATPEREDRLHELLPGLVGRVVYRLSVDDLRGGYLADYDIVRIYVRLGEEEARRYRGLVRRYREYLARRGLSLRRLEDFERLVMRSGYDPEAREALLAWMEARRLAFNAEAKLEKLRELLSRHRRDRVIIFTDSNELARRISTLFLIPEITYKTPKGERRRIMDMFREGALNAIVTSHVLEEGVDVPEANVAVIISGTGSRREFVQRLGRVLRPKDGKKAVLYEIVTRGTGEVFVSKRRKRGRRRA